MVKRVKIGLIYSYNTHWVAGAYYILNLVQALNTQKDEDKPELIILSHTQEEFNTVKDTGYPYLKFHPLVKEDFAPSYSITERVINKLFRTVAGKNIIQKTHTRKKLSAEIDVLFPASTHIFFSDVKNRLFWVPDFQEHFLPHFFSEEEIQLRKKHQQFLSQGCSIVFSSNDAASHFKQIYPASTAQIHVLPFAVTHPSFSELPIETVLLKYVINQPYFFCPNQVWQHKNHITVLKAIKKLKEEGEENVLVVFSGKEYDNRHPGVFEGLKKYISENGLEKNAKFLGFIDRSEQLQLMNNAVCVIQPSLFEGWSTSVEDAKAMQQYVIASNLAVHREQLQKNALFFEPENILQLATCLKNIKPQARPITNDYEKDVFKFGYTFIEIVKKITAN